MGIPRRDSRGPARPAGAESGRLGRLRIGTRLLLLLLVPTSALLVLTGIANWKGLQQVRQLADYQRLTETSIEVSEIGEAVARERAASVRDRVQPSRAGAAARRSRQEAVDRLIATVERDHRAAELGDAGGRLDAVSRQLFALRMRTESLPVAELQQGYGQAIDGLGALQRALAGSPPTRDVATTVIADVAMRSAIEAARREQLDVWAALMRRQSKRTPVAIGGQWAALERSGLDAFRSWAPPAAVANLNAALFSTPGLAVRQRRQQLSDEGLVTGPAQASQWWQQTGARLAALGRVRAGTRHDVTDAIAANLADERASVSWRLALSLFVVAVSVGLGLLLRRSIARSLRELSRSARALSSGQLDTEIDTAGGDEIAAVAAAFTAVRTTNQQLVAEVHAMNKAIATQQLTRRADATAFRGAWADVLDGMNGTMTEVARLQASEQREVERQEIFGLVGRHVVSGDLAIDEAYVQCCRLLVEHVGAARAEVYEQTVEGWRRRAIAGVQAPPWPPMHEFSPERRRADSLRAVVRSVGSGDDTSAAILVAEFADADPLAPADRLFVDGVGRLLDEASNHRRAETERVRAQKIEATGTLAATFAHDFNNVLGAILNHARLGELETSDQQASATFSEIGGAVQRASDVVDRLLKFSRSAPPGNGEFDLPALVEEACALVRPGLPATIELDFSADDQLPVIAGDPSRIHQVVVNLITNAAQALGSSPGRITVTVDKVLLPGPDREPGDASTALFARVRVRDTGPGIPESIARRIFDPFFTTKPEGQGTGLGLASALTIARDHHGTLDVRSAPEGGTTATLCLPSREPSTAR